jgi:hypothetical protein
MVRVRVRVRVRVMIVQRAEKETLHAVRVRLVYHSLL